MAVIYVSRGVDEQYNAILEVNGEWDFEGKGWKNSNPSGIHVELSANQSANLLVGDHVEFNTIVNFFQTELLLSTGSGQANGIFSNFKAGKLYKLEAQLEAELGSNLSAFQYQWYDLLAGVFRGTVGGQFPSRGTTLAGFILSGDQTSNTGFLEFDIIVSDPPSQDQITLDSTGIAKVTAGSSYIINSAIAFDALTGTGIAVEWQVEESLDGTTGWTPSGIKGRSTSPNTTTNQDDTPVTECVRGFEALTDIFIRIAYTILGGTFQQIDADASRMVITAIGTGSNLVAQQNAVVMIDNVSDSLTMELRILTGLDIKQILDGQSYALITQQ